MVSNQPGPRLEYFPLHSIQPFRVKFDFVLNGKGKGAGNVRFKLLIGNRKYGPFKTTLETTFTIYNGRTRLTVPLRSKNLVYQLLGIRYHLVETWASFDAKAKPITARMILSRSRFKKVVGAGGPVYAV